jgi:hypothetical protein
VANKARPQERDRRAKVEALRREQQAKERRKSLMFIGGSILIGLALIAIVAFPAIQRSRNDPVKKDLGTFGVATSAASCSAATTDKATGGSDHQPNGTKIKYDQVPPSSGPHWNPPVQSPLEFYTAEDRPAMEELVHNLEHGYSIVWYDSTIKGDQLQALKDISARARTEKDTRGKFIVSAWDDAYGKFPAGKHVAMSHWGAQSGHRQLCGTVSGEAVAAFIKKYPATDAPEPNGA